MRPVPFIYTTDMARSIEWYRTVIPSATLVSESAYWSEFDIGGDVLALLVERARPLRRYWGHSPIPNLWWLKAQPWRWKT